MQQTGCHSLLFCLAPFPLSFTQSSACIINVKLLFCRPWHPAALLTQDLEAIEKNLESAIKEAEATCNGGDAAHCAAA